MIGADALDWLFVPNADVWISDMVREEAIRDPDPGDDQRWQHRAVLRGWFARNENRIHIKATSEGEEYAKAMKTWQLAGAKPELIRRRIDDRSQGRTFRHIGRSAWCL